MERKFEIMIRFSSSLKPRQLRILRSIVKKKGAESVAELIRTSIDFWLATSYAKALQKESHVEEISNKIVGTA